MKKYIWIGISVCAVIAVGFSSALLVEQRAHNQKMEKIARASSQQAASVRESEAADKRKKAKAAQSAKAAKQAEAKQARESQSVYEEELATSAVTTSVVEQSGASTTNQSTSDQSVVAKVPNKTGSTGTAVAVIETNPNQDERDDLTRAYVEAGVLNPQGGMKYDPEIEAKAQSNLKRYQEED